MESVTYTLFYQHYFKHNHYNVCTYHIIGVLPLISIITRAKQFNHVKAVTIITNSCPYESLKRGYLSTSRLLVLSVNVVQRKSVQPWKLVGQCSQIKHSVIRTTCIETKLTAWCPFIPIYTSCSLNQTTGEVVMRQFGCLFKFSLECCLHNVEYIILRKFDTLEEMKLSLCFPDPEYAKHI